MKFSIKAIFFLLAVTLPILQAYAASYSAVAISGKLIDHQTGAPLEGVNIVATWKIARRSSNDDKTVLHVAETVSDKNGNYSLPAWGPITLPEKANFQHGRDPGIDYFKSGYWPEYVQNEAYVNLSERTVPLGKFIGNNKTVKLKKWDGKDAREYSFAVSMIVIELPEEHDLWKKYPRMLLTLIKEQESLQQLGVTYGLAGLCPECYGPEYLEFIKRFGQ